MLIKITVIAQKRMMRILGSTESKRVKRNLKCMLQVPWKVAGDNNSRKVGWLQFLLKVVPSKLYWVETNANHQGTVEVQ